MKTLIDEIIDIDKAARAKADDAGAYAARLLSEANEKKEQLKSSMYDRANARIETARVSYAEISSEEIAELIKQKDEAVKKIDTEMEKNSEKWHNEILLAIEHL